MSSDYIKRAEPLPHGVVEIATISVFLACLMFLLSVTGVIWIGAPTIAPATVISLLISIVLTMRVGRLNVRASLVWLTVAAPFVAIPVLSSFVPPFTWDEAAYSVALPKLYAAAHRIYYANAIGVYSAFPASYEALTTSSLLLTGSITAMRLIGVACLVGMGGIAVVLSRVCGNRTTAAILAGCFVVAAEVGIFSSQVKNDFVNAFLQASAILFLTAYMLRPRATWAIFAGLVLGTSCGIKYNSLQFVLCATAFAIPFVWWAGRQGPIWKHAFFFCVSVTAAGAFWYAHNYLAFGNPFHPFFTPIFGDHSPGAEQLTAIVNEAFYGLAGFSYASSSPSVFMDAVIDQFGLALLIVGIIGLAGTTARLGKMSGGRRLAAAFLIVVTLAYSLVCFFFGLWAPRYFAVLLPCYAVFAAAAIELIFIGLNRAVSSSRWAETTVGFALGCALLFHSVERQWRESGWLVNAALAGKSSDLVPLVVNYWNLADWINKNLPTCSKIGVGIDVQPFYYIDRNYYNFAPLSEEFMGLGAADFPARFRALGLTHIALQEFAGRDVYPEEKNPRMYLFINGLYAAVNRMAQAGSAKIVNVLPGLKGNVIKIYHLDYAPETSSGGVQASPNGSNCRS